MELLQTVLIALVTLGILVAIHEFGHFWVARRCGVKVIKFSIGFGPDLLRYTAKDGVVYSFSAIPLGGYVRMAGEDDDESRDAEPHEMFDAKTVWQRIAIVGAGPAINLLLAVVVFFGLSLRGEVGLAPVIGNYEPTSPAASLDLSSGQEIYAVDGKQTSTWREVSLALLDRVGDSGIVSFTVGYPESTLTYDVSVPIEGFLSQGEVSDPIQELGIEPWLPPLRLEVSSVQVGSPAEYAGLLVGDVIESTDGIVFERFTQWSDYIQDRADQEIALGLLRNSESLTLTIVPKESELNNERRVLLGVSLLQQTWPEEMVRRYHYSIPEALWNGVDRTVDTSIFIVKSIAKMITGDISTKNLSGPITIAKVASDSAANGVASWLSLLALLSVSLGVLNLLPIPVLDGGHLLFYFIEAVKGSPVDKRVQQYGMQAGMALVLLVTLLAIYNDILRL
ncbi:RIP metalloprotease RseP [uncultured Umboniibacter sp.]|uniref:RIP metalloprotease RseP n=1 Tax=uncultured Umboniibacter sp. TaxID=1798917 RepID=UPI00261C0797|nr:RIP metalloprotease RseP [uncultured Umboniibacter sp.]